MNRRKFVKAVPSMAVLAGSASSYSLHKTPLQGLQSIVLPQPEHDGGKSVLASLLERKTTRTISSKELPIQVISNLLWAAFGVNRDTAGLAKKEEQLLQQAIPRKSTSMLHYPAGYTFMKLPNIVYYR